MAAQACCANCAVRVLRKGSQVTCQNFVGTRERLRKRQGTQDVIIYNPTQAPSPFRIILKKTSLFVPVIDYDENRKPYHCRQQTCQD